MADGNLSIKISKGKILHIFLQVLSNQKLIFISAVIYGFIILSISLFVYYNYPLRSTGRVDFTLNKITNNKFPNGTSFNLNEIITPEILFAVYKNNSLQSYFKSFDIFRSSVNITKDADPLIFLNKEYSDKLWDENLMPAAKIGLEQEYTRKKENIINSSNFCILFDCKSTSIGLTKDLILKTMSDILSEWLNTAIKLKKIDKNDISLLTKSAITDATLNSLDYLMGIDILRKYLKDIGKDIDKIESISNSNSLTINNNGVDYSLSDIKLKYKFLKEYQLDPLIGIIEDTLKTKYDPMAKIYLENRLKSISDELSTLEERKYMKQSLDQTYSGSTTSEIDAINNKIIELKNEQLFYAKMESQIRLAPTDSKSAGNTSSIDARIKKEQYKLLQSIYEIIDLLQQFNLELGKANFGQPSSYYTIISANASITRGTNLKNIMVIAIIGWLVCIAITIKLIFLFKYFIPDLKRNMKNNL